MASSVPVDDQFKFQREYSNGELYAHVTGSYSFYGASGGPEQAENAYLEKRRLIMTRTHLASKV